MRDTASAANMSVVDTVRTYVWGANRAKQGDRERTFVRD